MFVTGGRPRRLELAEAERVIYFRSFDDYRRLREFSGRDLKLAVIGGGFIGTELAAALVQNNKNTTLLFDDETLDASIFPSDLANSFHDLYERHGVTLIAGTKVSGGRVGAEHVLLDYDGGPYEFDAVVVGLGIEPATELAQAAGINADDGVLVDEPL